MSEELVWQILKKRNGKTLRRTHPVRTFTTEKGTLENKRTLRDSGLARAKAVDVTANEDGIPVLSLKNDKPEDARCPDKMWRVVILDGGVRKALAKTDQLLSAYHPAMKKPAMKKVNAIYKAAQRKNKNIAAA